MRKLGLLSACVATAAFIAGCGGGGGGGSKNVTRTVAGFVYVLGGTGTGGDAAVVIPTAVAPAGYFPPTSGTVTLSVTDGTISRAPDSEPFNMATSNAVICSVKAKENTLVSVTGSGLNFEGNPRALAGFSENIGVKADSNTVLGLNNGDTTYTPGPEASLMYTIDGEVPTNPEQAFIAGGAAQSLSVIALDASGVIVTTSTFNVSSDGPEVVVSGTNPGAGPFDLTPATSAVAEDTVEILIDSVDSNLQAVINGNFDHGTPTTITVSASASSVTWGTATPVVANTTTTVTATVLNQVGAPMPGEVVTLSTDKIPSAGNAWSGAEAALLGNAFATQSGPADGSGQHISTFAPPTELDPTLNAGQLAVKGVNVITATAGSASGTANVTILRPIGALTIVGPSRLDTGTSSSTTVGGPQTYALTGATDVDGDNATIPAGAVTWSIANAAFAANVGNTGNQQAGSVSASSIDSTTGVVTAGNVAGTATVTATIGTVDSNDITTEIFGVPSKIILTPDTAVSVIPGATGQYGFGTVGQTQAATIALQDSSGHVTPLGEITGFTSTFSIQALTGGSITNGGAGVSSFTVTCGNTDGLFSVTINGTWTGALGGSGSINLNRDIGQDAPVAP